MALRKPCYTYSMSVKTSTKRTQRAVLGISLVLACLLALPVTSFAKLAEVVPLGVRRAFEKQYDIGWEDGSDKQHTEFLEKVRRQKLKKERYQQKKKQAEAREKRRKFLKEQKKEQAQEKAERAQLKQERQKTKINEKRKKKLEKHFQNMFKKSETGHRQ